MQDMLVVGDTEGLIVRLRFRPRGCGARETLMPYKSGSTGVRLRDRRRNDRPGTRLSAAHYDAGRRTGLVIYMLIAKSLLSALR
jgi:hypothetical protein